jgi:Na+/H+ antiporter NhaC
LATKHQQRLAVVVGTVLLLSLAATVLAQTNTASEASAATDGYGWLSLLPPLVAIGLALVFRDVMASLLVGVFGGALLLHGPNPFTAFARTVDSLLRDALADPDHAAVILFSALLGAMVGVVMRSGGTQGIVALIATRATDGRRGQLATWLMGVAIFFDDYANTLIVGPTMRPITDRLRISREKLAFIVDSTAAPIASVIPISTWIGVELGLVQTSFTTAGIDRDAFGALIASIAYRFYPLFALALGFTIAFTGRDYGPMLAAERRASGGKLLDEGHVPLSDFTSSELAPLENKPARARNALIPILVVVAVTIGGLIVTGMGAAERAPGQSTLGWIRTIFGAADSYAALMWASFAGVAVAILMAVTQRILKVGEATGAAIVGLKATLPALVVITLAWALSAVCDQLGTASFLAAATDGVVQPQLLPTIIFVLAAAMSFATGTAWGTMGIVIPIAVPLAHQLLLSAGHSPGSSIYEAVLLGSLGSVLAGSVWGDHCSPISDTTILSSMASGCDHIAHVRTQLPYALTGGGFAVVLGTLPTAFGVPPWVCWLLGSAVLFFVVRRFGRKIATD